ncbi:MAG: hypothetical protein IKG66_06400 [Lachnospiraceae bacterium]|nr:hypothetical protein [Lachnospiraceae bacterium]
MKKLKVLTAAILAAIALVTAGCGSGEPVLSMDMIDEKTAVAELNGAGDGDYVVVGTLTVAEGEKIVLESELKKGSEVLVQFITAEDGDALADFEDTDAVTAFEDFINDSSTISVTADAGDYYIKVLSQNRSTGTIRITAQPAQ